MKQAADIIGQRFGMLTVIRYVPKAEALAAGAKYAHYLAQCDCGRTTKASSSTPFTSGLRGSCGCYRPPINEGIPPSRNRTPRDLASQRFGKLVAVELVPPPPGKSVGRRWLCRCDCGGERVVRASHLSGGAALSCTSCSMIAKNSAQLAKPQGHNLTGMRFGILTVADLAPAPPGGQGRYWSCKCDCGAVKVIRAKDLRNGNTASCGCMQKPPGRGKREPKLDINRPWRKAENVDDRWLVLLGERCPPRAAS